MLASWPFERSVWGGDGRTNGLWYRERAWEAGLLRPLRAGGRAARRSGRMSATSADEGRGADRDAQGALSGRGDSGQVGGGQSDGKVGGGQSCGSRRARGAQGGRQGRQRRGRGWGSQLWSAQVAVVVVQAAVAAHAAAVGDHLLDVGARPADELRRRRLGPLARRADVQRPRLASSTSSSCRCARSSSSACALSARRRPAAAAAARRRGRPARREVLGRRRCRDRERRGRRRRRRRRRLRVGRRRRRVVVRLPRLALEVVHAEAAVGRGEATRDARVSDVAREDARMREEGGEGDALLLHHAHVGAHERDVLVGLALARLERVLLEQELLELVRRVKVGLLCVGHKDGRALLGDDRRPVERRQPGRRLDVGQAAAACAPAEPPLRVALEQLRGKRGRARSAPLRVTRALPSRGRERLRKEGDERGRTPAMKAFPSAEHFASPSSGHPSRSPAMLSVSALFVLPLNGLRPNRSSYTMTPRLHQSIWHE